MPVAVQSGSWFQTTAERRQDRHAYKAIRSRMPMSWFYVETAGYYARRLERNIVYIVSLAAPATSKALGRLFASDSASEICVYANFSHQDLMLKIYAKPHASVIRTTKTSGVGVVVFGTGRKSGQGPDSRKLFMPLQFSNDHCQRYFTQTTARFSGGATAYHTKTCCRLEHYRASDVARSHICTVKKSTRYSSYPSSSLSLPSPL